MNLLFLASGVTLVIGSPGTNIEFPWGEKFGREYTSEVAQDPTSDAPFRFKRGETETQHCLGVDDADLFSARMSALIVAFPRFESKDNPETSPRSAQEVLDNSEKMFDKHSSMYIHGVGYYVGPLDIGNYVAVPHRAVSNIQHGPNVNSTKGHVININTFVLNFTTSEQWAHLDPNYVDPDTFDYANVPPEFTNWIQTYEFYPCSVKINRLTLAFPDFTLQQFINAGAAPGAMQKTCTTLMKECVGDKQQFLDHDDCMDYMSTLPHVDPLCVNKYGGQAVQGNSFMCKYVHNFMTSTQPELHCFHAGKGLMDHRGKRKCSPADCLLDSAPDNIKPVYLNEPSGPTLFLKNGDSGLWVETLADASMVPVATLEAANVLLKSHSVHQDNSCTEEDEDEIAVATVYALAPCLPFLGSNGVCSESCTQAINTYFGRYATNDALCSCSKRTDHRIVRRSALLKFLDVDPLVFLNRCPPTAFKLPDCVDVKQEPASDVVCPDGTYSTRQGCQIWSYDSMVAAMYADWSGAAKMHGRITESDDVAMAECEVLTIFEQLQRSGQFYNLLGPINPSTWQLAETERHLNIHPGLNSTKLNYDDFLKAWSDPAQKRNSNSVRSLPCIFNIDSEMDKSGMGIAPIRHTTGSQAHQAVRRMLIKTMPGLNNFTSQRGADHFLAEHNYAYFEDQFQSEFLRRELTNEYVESAEDIASITLYVISRSIFNYPVAKHIDAERWKEVNDGMRVFLSARSSTINRVHGEMASTAILSTRANFVRMMKDIIPFEDMRAWVVESGWWDARQNLYPELHDLDLHNELDLQLAYPDKTGDLFGLSFFTTLMIERLRRDECDLMPIWQQPGGPQKVVFEHLRLCQGVNGAVIDDTIYSLLNANLDSNVFENPYDFNPDRADLHMQFSFNAPYTDILDPPTDDLWFPAGNVSNTTLHRACVGRFFAPEFMKSAAPFFLPKNHGQQCANGHRVRSGVSFKPTLFDVKPTLDVADDVKVEVLQAEGAGITENADRLLILLSDFGEPPLVWGPTVGRLQNYFTGVALPGGHTMNTKPGSTGTHYWALALPGHGKGTPLANCSFDYTSELVTDLVNHAKKTLGYNRIYIVGRGLGGLLGWYVAQEAESREVSLVNGFVTFAPHPIIFTTDHADKPFDEFFARPMIDPILSTVYLGSTDLMEKIVFDRFDWDKYDTEYKMQWLWDYRRFWQQTGPERLTCYYRDNFYSKNGHLTLKDPVVAANVLPEQTHVKLMDFAFDPFFTKSSVMKSAYFLIVPNPVNGRILDYHSLKGSHSVENFFDENTIDSVARQVSKFVHQTQLQSFSSWQFVVDNVFKHKLEHQYNPYSTTGAVTVVFAILMVMTGLLLEHLIGPYTWKLMGTRNCYRFCKCFSTITFYSTLAAGRNGIILIPLMVLAVFDFGFPQANALLGRPLRQIPGITKFQKWRSFFDGVGVIIHHSGGFVVVAAVVSGRSPGLLFLFPGIPIMIEHLLVSLNVFRISTHPVYKYSVMAFLTFTEVWLYLEVVYLWYVADTFGAIGSVMIAAGHIVWTLNTTAAMLRGMASSLHDKLAGEDPEEMCDHQYFFRYIMTNIAKSKVDQFI